MESALKHYEWVLRNQDPETGWFYNSGFSSDDHKERRAVTHTIAYTLWGVLHMAEIFNRTDGIIAVEKAADKIAELQFRYNMLPGVLNYKWEPQSMYSCLTGNSQLALIWLRLYKITKNKRYLEAAIKSIDSVKFCIDLKVLKKGLEEGFRAHTLYGVNISLWHFLIGLLNFSLMQF